MARRSVVYREPQAVYVYQNGYGFFSFCGDVFMTLLTGGLWLIWIFVREMRRR